MERADERLEKYHKEKVKGDSLTQEEKIKNITEKLLPVHTKLIKK